MKLLDNILYYILQRREYNGEQKAETYGHRELVTDLKAVTEELKKRATVAENIMKALHGTKSDR